MANKKNAALIALLESNTIADAAEASGISIATLYRYLADPAFKARFQKAKADLIDAALVKLQRACAQAVDVLVEIMSDVTVAPGIRVRAADSILSRSVDTVKIEALESRIAKLEEEKP